MGSKFLPHSLLDQLNIGLLLLLFFLSLFLLILFHLYSFPFFFISIFYIGIEFLCRFGRLLVFWWYIFMVCGCMNKIVLLYCLFGLPSRQIKWFNFNIFFIFLFTILKPNNLLCMKMVKIWNLMRVIRLMIVFHMSFNQLLISTLLILLIVIQLFHCFGVTRFL